MTSFALTWLLLAAAPSHPNRVEVVRDERGFKLQVDGEDTMVLGMNWGYMPIGKNYSDSLWTQPDDVIEEALDREMTLLQKMGANVVRQYTGVPARWITYIYEKYGIYTVLNHSMGRYGVNVDGVWIAQTNYGDPRTREVITGEIIGIVEEFKNTPGLLMWLLGNENNYGLVWKSAETEDLPPEAANRARAVHLYTLFGDIAAEIKKRDKNHPVAIANGDLQYIDLIAEYCEAVDVIGSNVYRGYSSGDLFDQVKEKLDRPFVYTEFGADAYNAKEKREDQVGQAEYFRTLWQEVYEHSYGKGRAGNAIGGMSFQWSDGWWKYLQTENLDVHDTTASWANDAYPHDYVEGDNNMNEEWFGICAKGRPDERGIYDVYPRAAYYVLQDGYRLDPYDDSVTLERIREHWGSISSADLSRPYKVDSALGRLEELSIVRLKNLRMEIETFTTDSRKNTEIARRDLRFDHLESFYLDVESNPSSNLRTELSVNILGNVPTNPIDEIFYENRGETITVENTTEGKEVELDGLERLKVYRATVEWDESWFQLKGFYREGHYHWGYEGDFFGLYRDAYYGEAIDIYNSDVPIGLEIAGKRQLKGLKLAFGPELYWGANPMVIGKYEHSIPGIDLDVAIVHQEEFAQREAAAVSTVIPTPKSRRTSLYLAKDLGEVKLELGGLLAGTPLIDRPFTRAERAKRGQTSYLNSGFNIADDQVRLIDTLAAKAKVSVSVGRFNWYVQGAYKGIVADGGPDPTLTFTGWRLKESGLGNHYNVLTGAAVMFGDFQIAPNFIYQKPLVDPLPTIDDFFDPDTGDYFPGVTPRNVLDDPFVVRGNQEMLGYELMLVYDPTPETFMWAFDNERREDAPFAFSLDFVWRDYRQSQDAGIGVFADGGFFAFPSAPPAEDLWEINARAISNPAADLRLLLDIVAGRGQSRGDDERLVDRFAASARVTWQRWALGGLVKIDDWGPYDYYKDFNFTFPLQLMGDLSYGAVLPRWLGDAYSRFGVRGQYRTMDEFSSRFRVGRDPDRLGAEWQITTYLHVTL